MGILRNPRYAGYSVYSASKTRKQEPSESRRRELKNNIVRDEHGEIVHGTWTPIVAEDAWWTVQNILDDPKRLTNRAGSTVRKHLGAGLYRCGECGRNTITNGIYYSCPDGHLHRTKTHVDKFVKAVVVERLKQKDLNRKKKTIDPDASDEYSQAIARQRARIARAEHDYDQELIQGTDLKRIRDAATKEIKRLEAERLARGVNTIMAPVLLTDDPARAFLNASMPAQRIIIDTIMSVTLKKHPRGVRGFDPKSIDITWKED